MGRSSSGSTYRACEERRVEVFSVPGGQKIERNLSPESDQRLNERRTAGFEASFANASHIGEVGIRNGHVGRCLRHSIRGTKQATENNFILIVLSCHEPGQLSE